MSQSITVKLTVEITAEVSADAVLENLCMELGNARVIEFKPARERSFAVSVWATINAERS